MADDTDAEVVKQIQFAPNLDGSNWLITLVHGTWGRGFFPTDAANNPPRWFETSSTFTKNLVGCFALDKPPNIEVFKWSGRNSIVDRDEAAQQLARQLKAQQITRSNAQQLVIAHSHGGNIALRAVEYLGDSALQLRIATLACPFIEVFPPSFDVVPRHKWVFLFVSWLGLLLPLILAARLLPLWITIVAGLVWCSIGLFIVRQEVSRWGHRRQSPQKKSFADEMARRSSHAAYARSAVKTLVLRGIDDEASLALAAGAITQRLTRGMAFLFGHAATLMLQVVVAMVAVLMVNEFLGLEDNLGFRLGEHVSTNLIYAVLYLPLLLLWIALAVSASCDAVYGRELFGRFLGAEISSNSVPDSYGGVVAYTLIAGKPEAGMRHMLYDHPHCAPRAVSWAASSFANAEDPWKEGDERRMSRWSEEQTRLSDISRALFLELFGKK